MNENETMIKEQMSIIYNATQQFSRLSSRAFDPNMNQKQRKDYFLYFSGVIFAVASSLEAESPLGFFMFKQILSDGLENGYSFSNNGIINYSDYTINKHVERTAENSLSDRENAIISQGMMDIMDFIISKDISAADNFYNNYVAKG